MKLLFVCTGNICRSPTAEGVMIEKLRQNGIGDKVSTDSAGTHNYHVGACPDRRSTEVAKRRGYDLSCLRARKVSPADYYEFDLILCMDKGHLETLEYDRPDNATAEIALYLEYAGLGPKDVADPYYGGGEGFEKVLDQIEEASERIIQKISSKI